MTANICSFGTMSIPTISTDRLALFLDVDGTLIEMAPTPHSVVVPDSLKALLERLLGQLSGAMALVSGRSIADLDALFAPFQFPASGVHGFERREGSGPVTHPRIDTSHLSAVHAELTEWVKAHSGLLMENKGYALAVHYRLAPEMEHDVHAHLVKVLERVGGAFNLHRGKFVFEIRPSGFSKANGVQAFMQAAPFAGRTPLFIGDDVTDEDGFAMVNDLGGISIRVGDSSPTQAKHRLANVTAVKEWLSGLSPATS